jgi:hypothetical protein
MCFSKNASIASFTIGIVGSLLCISLGTITDKILGYFLFYISLMQGIEYLLWSHQKCDNYNRFVSIIGMLLNNMQPLVLGLIILWLNPKIRHINWFYFFMFLYLCAAIPYSLSFINNKKLQCTIKNKQSQHLDWNWNTMKYYSLVYLIFIITACVSCILGFPNPIHGWIFAFFILFTYLTSSLLYSSNVGALWCYYSVFIPIIYYLIRRFNINLLQK